jgi:hypothetical protein
MKSRLVTASLLILSLAIVGLATQVSAQQGGTSSELSLRPGEIARVPVRFWCLDFGKPFPAQMTGPQGRARQEIIDVIQAAQNQNATAEDPYQVQLAIWRVADGAYHDVGGRGHALADRLLAAAPNVTPAVGASNTTFLGLQNRLDLYVTVEGLRPISDAGAGTFQPYYGTATLVIRNLTQNTINLLVTGAMFQPVASNEQTVVAEQMPGQTSVSPTATQEMMTTAVPLGTIEPMGTASSVETAAPIETPALMGTAAPAETTLAGTASITETPVPTETTAPMETAVPSETVVVGAASVSETPAPTWQVVAPLGATPQTLPLTGAGESGGLLLPILAMGALALFGGLGLAGLRTRK